jgi:hypothetical protein
MVHSSTSISWESVHRILHCWLDMLVSYILLFDACIFTDDFVIYLMVSVHKMCKSQKNWDRDPGND